MLERHPDRVLFGTDEVAPKDQASYLKIYDQYAPLWQALTPRPARSSGSATTNDSSTTRASRSGRGRRPNRSVGPAIDMHSHIALAYLLPMRVDVHRATDHTEHYLPACCPIDFEVYQNRNFTTAALRALKRDLTLGSLSRGGMRATHRCPTWVREMDERSRPLGAVADRSPLLSNTPRMRWRRRGASRGCARSVRCIRSSIASACASTSRRMPGPSA